jgi:hypothetical protein
MGPIEANGALRCPSSYQVERALRSRRAELLVWVSSGGEVVIQDLLLDGVPWREAVR